MQVNKSWTVNNGNMYWLHRKGCWKKMRTVSEYLAQEQRYCFQLNTQTNNTNYTGNKKYKSQLSSVTLLWTTLDLYAHDEQLGRWGSICFIRGSVVTVLLLLWVFRFGVHFDQGASKAHACSVEGRVTTGGIPGKANQDGQNRRPSIATHLHGYVRGTLLGVNRHSFLYHCLYASKRSSHSSLHLYLLCL